MPLFAFLVLVFWIPRFYHRRAGSAGAGHAAAQPCLVVRLAFPGSNELMAKRQSQIEEARRRLREPSHSRAFAAPECAAWAAVLASCRVAFARLRHLLPPCSRTVAAGRPRRRSSILRWHFRFGIGRPHRRKRRQNGLLHRRVEKISQVAPLRKDGQLICGKGGMEP